jgi:hypothetical protein
VQRFNGAAVQQYLIAIVFRAALLGVVELQQAGKRKTWAGSRRDAAC